jgi:hypothetical protein
MKKKLIFILGGHDLEMLEIRHLLEKMPEIQFFDRGLHWKDADILAYDDILIEFGNKDNVEIYGIELRTNNASLIPLNYFSIDHHNDSSDKPSSLEQVAEMLHITLSREQQLIAANDKGYILAMQQSGASPNEIEEIRLHDRQAQGVTAEDEQKAEISVRNKIIEKDVIVVKSLTDRFSTICDRLFPYNQLLVYTDKELVYYGKGKKNIVKHYIESIKNGKMYHGGGDEGFFGTAQNRYSKEEIIEIKNNIVQLINL